MRHLAALLLSISLSISSSAAMAKELRLGVYNFMPLVGNGADNQGEGLFVEVFRHIADLEGWELSVVPGTWAENLDRLERDEIDVLAGIAYSPERAQRFDFTQSYLFLDWGLVYQPVGGTIENILDLSGKRIAVLDGSIYTQGFQALLDQFGIQAELIVMQEYEAIFRAISEKIVDAGINAQLYGQKLADRYTAAATQIYFTPVKIRFAVRKGTFGTLLGAIDRQVGGMKADPNSYYHQRLRFWLDQHGGSGLHHIPEWLQWTLLVAGAIFLATLILLKILQRRVRSGHQAIQESERQFRELVELSKDLITRIDTDGRLIYCNHMANLFYGLPPEDCIGRPAFDFIHPDDRERTARAFKEWRKSTDGFFEFENRHVTPQGHTYHLQWRVTATRDSNGAIRSFVGTARDITAQHLNKTRIEASESYFRTIFSAAMLPMAIAEAETGLIIDCNTEFCRLIGRERSKIIGMSQKDLHPDVPDHREVSDEFNQQRAENAPSVVRSRIITASGALRDVEIKAGRIELKGKQCLFGMFNDITDRVQAERQLRLAQKMEAVGQMAGGVAHDFNNILGAIMGRAELSLMRINNTAQLTENLKAILTSSERAKKLVRELLSFSRRTPMDTIPVKVEEIVKEVFDMVRATTPATIDLHLQVEASDLCVQADPTLLHQILMNLMANAVHAIETDTGKIDIELTEMMATNHEQPHEPAVPSVRIMVRDTGVGMSPELLPRIFEPFFTTRDSGKGTGLGLSVVHNIVREMGGFIEVASKPDQGTTFYVYLPLSREGGEPEIEAQDENDSLPRASGLVLIVDDEETLLSVSRTFLETIGCTVETTTDPLEALAWVNDPDKPIDLLITDLYMPRLSGRELCRRAQEMRPDLPVILCSGYTDEPPSRNEAGQPNYRFLHKPISFATLTKEVATILHARGVPSFLRSQSRGP